jgi:lipoprotein-releasing system ATP-binding protein
MSKPILNAQNISKTFSSGTDIITVLGGVDLTLNVGEIVSIRGESGSGKSTMLNILAALESMDKGNLIWSNQFIPAHNKQSNIARYRASFIGMIFQFYHLIAELNVFENVLFPARILGRIQKQQQKRAQTLLQRVGLSKRLKSNVFDLSGGERQRVAIARALINYPQIILADEPTGNLDEATAASIIDLLFEICHEEQATLVLVTHNPEFADRADRQLVLQDGILHPSASC